MRRRGVGISWLRRSVLLQSCLCRSSPLARAPGLLQRDRKRRRSFLDECGLVHTVHLTMEQRAADRAAAERAGEGERLRNEAAVGGPERVGGIVVYLFQTEGQLPRRPGHGCAAG